ncbi:TetR/AcrR family transcriptional regulator [Saccharopolyspora sp. 5N708]|uniref:TetR/AcrR family transcriptional regulator n=1 Tax=Saccharopolyspora sp. 5N708 TaxID=3457424 RepID=UPI003FD447F9
MGEQQVSGRASSFVERVRREQIVRAAVGVIAEVGYEKASFARIAARAGISPSLISYHFASKANLIGSVAATIGDELGVALEAAVGDAETALDVLRRLVRGFVRYAAAHRDEMMVFYHLERASGRAGSPIGEIDRERDIRRMAELLSAAVAAGEVRDADTRVMALGIQSFLEQLPGMLFGDPDADAELIAEQAADFLVNAVASQSTERN